MSIIAPKRAIRTIVCAMAIATLTVAAEAADSADSGSLAAEIQQLKALLVEQQRQINELRKALIERNATPAPAAETAGSPYKKLGEVGSTTPMIPPAPAPAPLSSPVIAPQQAEAAKPAPTPLQLKIGETYLTPVGFMDFTGVFRDTAPGSGIGTNFGSFPYRTQAAVNGNLSEFKMSPQNSRIGLRFDSKFKGINVLGYWESDFLGGVGNPPVGNAAVSTNSYPLRLRLYWVDLKKDKWEILGGQTWSLLAPGRNGISPLPGDVFYSQVIDVNYTVGVPCCRFPEFRVVYRPTKNVAAAFALDNPEQYVGGSGGGGTITLPSGLSSSYGSQLSNGTLTLGTPNAAPDMIAKLAVDGKMKNGNAAHFEVAGLLRTFKTYLPATGQHFTAAGGGFAVNLNVEVLKGLRLLTNNYYSQGGGRYLFGQAPDVVVQSDGSLSTVKSMGTVSGFEYTRKNTLLYAYYGGVYIDRNVVQDTTGSKPALAGYGYSGAPNSQNKSVQQATFGFNQTMWKDPRYGAINFMGQYAYFSRNPWSLATGVPTHAYMNEIWLNLRYTLPGSAPALK
ncbi:MAG: hypothetical protein JSU00_25015 [Acidobacteria bacterium]|nr:hypothetical protein [Acidobacteriota bacterium]